MGFGPSGPRVIPAAPQGEGLAQFAQGISSVLSAAKEQKDFTKAAEEFDRIIKSRTKDGTVDYAGVGLDIEASRNISPKHKERLGSVIEKQSQQDLKRRELGQKKADVPTEEQLQQIFKEFGIKGKEADIQTRRFRALTPGARTDYVRRLLDAAERGEFGTPLFGSAGNEPDISEPGELPTEPGIVEEQAAQIQGNDPSQVDTIEEETFEFPEIDNFSGLTEQEKSSRRNEYLKQNKDIQKEIIKSRDEYEDTDFRLKQLKNLNERKNLPESIGRLNVNPKTGELILPAAASAETQLYVKTINDWVTQAKNSFGARVTNFDLIAFMRRLPTLANSEEGRRVIIEQMQVINDLNKLHSDSLAKVYRKYGEDKISPLQADTVARDLKKKDMDLLVQRGLQAIDLNKVAYAREKLPEGRIMARSPNGEIVGIKPEEAEIAASKGFQIIGK